MLVNFSVGLRSVFRRNHPTARSEKHEAVKLHRVVLNRVNPVFRNHGFHFAEAGPPVVVIALHDDFSARKLADLDKVCLSVVDFHAPRQIAGQKNYVFVGHFFVPILDDFFPIAFPCVAENVHRFVG